MTILERKLTYCGQYHDLILAEENEFQERMPYLCMPGVCDALDTQVRLDDGDAVIVRIASHREEIADMPHIVVIGTTSPEELVLVDGRAKYGTGTYTPFRDDLRTFGFNVQVFVGGQRCQ